MVLSGENKYNNFVWGLDGISYPLYRGLMEYYGINLWLYSMSCTVWFMFTLLQMLSEIRLCFLQMLSEIRPKSINDDLLSSANRGRKTRLRSFRPWPGQNEAPSWEADGGSVGDWWWWIDVWIPCKLMSVNMWYAYHVQSICDTHFLWTNTVGWLTLVESSHNYHVLGELQENHLVSMVVLTMARGGFYNDMIHRQEKFGAKNFVHIAWFI